MVQSSPNRSRFVPSCCVNPTARRAQQPGIELDNRALEPQTSWNRAQVAATVHKSRPRHLDRAQIGTKLCAIPRVGATAFNGWLPNKEEGRSTEEEEEHKQTQLRLPSRRTKREQTSQTLQQNTWRYALCNFAPSADR